MAAIMQMLYEYARKLNLWVTCVPWMTIYRLRYQLFTGGDHA
jgi:hypothetical protein